MKRGNDKDRDRIYKAWQDAYKGGYPELIGNFIIGFSSLENYINLWVSTVLDSKSADESFHVIALLDFSPKVTLLENMTLFKLGNAEAVQRLNFKSLIERVRKVTIIRNQIAHANWISMREGGELNTRVSFDSDTGEMDFKKVIITPTIINNAVKELEKIPVDLHKFFAELPEDIL